MLNLKGRELGPATALVGELGAESIDFLDMSCELEKVVTYQVDFKDIFRARRAKTGGTPDITIQDVVEYLMSKAAEA